MRNSSAVRVDGKYYVNGTAPGKSCVDYTSGWGSCAMGLRTDSILKVIVPVVLILEQIPFFIAFEMKKPKPRDLMPIAVLSVIGALGRAVFAAIPSFNPNSAVVIIAGMQFGPLAGFLTGSLSALASNMLLGQGPWTLWQMTAWGMMGCFAGVFQRTGIFKHRGLSY